MGKSDLPAYRISDYSSWAEVINWGLKINPVQTVFTGELADSVEKTKKAIRKK